MAIVATSNSMFSENYSLPEEIQYKIFGLFLKSHDFKILLSCSSVCKTWHRLVFDSRYGEKIKKILAHLCLIPLSATCVSSNGWSLLRSCYFCRCEIYLDRSGSMVDSDGFMSQVALRKTESLIKACKPFVKEIQVFTFSDTCSKEIVIHNKTNLGEAISYLPKKGYGGTNLRFLNEKCTEYNIETMTQSPENLTSIFVVTDFGFGDKSRKRLVENIDTIKKTANKFHNFSLTFFNIKKNEEDFQSFRSELQNSEEKIDFVRSFDENEEFVRPLKKQKTHSRFS
jgi:hypothetical protein